MLCIIITVLLLYYNMIIISYNNLIDIEIQMSELCTFSGFAF